jgi:hypothetical protein
LLADVAGLSFCHHHHLDKTQQESLEQEYYTQGSCKLFFLSGRKAQFPGAAHHEIPEVEWSERAGVKASNSPARPPACDEKSLRMSQFASLIQLLMCFLI